jgi:class 3 adenylate cyclase
MITWLLLMALVVAVYFLIVQRNRIRALQDRFEATTLELERVQQSCSLLAPAGVVQRVVSDGLENVAERKVVTAMFVDLVGYTALSEKLEPPTMAKLLNGYFQRVSDAVAEHRGRVATFLGDGILAFFGALEPNPWQCNDAVHAALAIRSAMRDYSRELEAEGLPPVGVGVGIHRGPGIAGLIGSRDRREYTVIGRTVNLAARVQALTRTHGTDILLTEAVRTELDPRFDLDEKPAMPVKGIAEPVVTWAVRGIQ